MELATSMSGTKPYMSPEIFDCAADACVGYRYPEKRVSEKPDPQAGNCDGASSDRSEFSEKDPSIRKGGLMGPIWRDCGPQVRIHSASSMKIVLQLWRFGNVVCGLFFRFRVLRWRGVKVKVSDC